MRNQKRREDADQTRDIAAAWKEATISRLKEKADKKCNRIALMKREMEELSQEIARERRWMAAQVTPLFVFACITYCPRPVLRRKYPHSGITTLKLLRLNIVLPLDKYMRLSTKTLVESLVSSIIHPFVRLALRKMLIFNKHVLASKYAAASKSCAS
jgi:hypothetical protein